MSEIVNKIANSPLVTIDLEDLYPEGQRMQIDLASWLEEGFILREKKFRDDLKNHDWSIYKDTYVALHCSTDAILPGWTYLLMTSYLQAFTKYVVVGDVEDLNEFLYHDLIMKLPLEPYQDKKVIIKGCSHKPVPPNAFLLLTQRLHPIVHSLMYGEACSTVPLYKKGFS